MREWTASDMRSIFSTHGFPPRGNPNDYEILAALLNREILSITAEPISLVPDPSIVVGYGPGREGEDHMDLKRCAVAWLRKKGIRSASAECYSVNGDRADVLSSTYVIECGDTSPAKVNGTLSQRCNPKRGLKWALLPRRSTSIRFDGFEHVEGGQIFVFRALQEYEHPNDAKMHATRVEARKYLRYCYSKEQRVELSRIRWTKSWEDLELERLGYIS